MNTNKLWLPKLDLRLLAVADHIRSDRHVDVGSDHGHLLFWLLQSGQIDFGIAIETNQLPFENSVSTLKKFIQTESKGEQPKPKSAEVRLGDGLSVYETGEADSLSICGLGGRAIVEILNAHPDRVPDRVILQPNNRPEYVRRWALKNRYLLQDEQTVGKELEFIVLSFKRRPNFEPANDSQFHDEAYEGVELETGILFGPLIIKRNEPDLRKRLEEELKYWSQFSKLKPYAAERLKLIKRLTNDLRQEIE